MQTPLTVITRIEPQQADPLRSLLEQIRENMANNSYIDFARITTIHFMRWVIIPYAGDVEPNHLLFTADFDGPLEGFLAELIAHAGTGLDGIWGKCEGYPRTRVSDPTGFPTALRQYIVAHSHEYDTQYNAYPDASQAMVRSAISGHDRMNRQLDAAPVADLGSVNRVLGILGRQVGPATSAPARLGIDLETRAHHAAVAVGQLAIFLGKLIKALAQAVVQSVPELPEVTLPAVNPSIEDQIVQNQMTILNNIRPGRWWLLRLRVVLAAINSLARINPTGSLSGLTTIHFARWAIIDNNTRLLFLSNYDGSWESYINDFVDRAADGLDAVWTSCVGYPPGGARSIDAFKQAIRRHQYQASLYYSAVPSSSVKNVLNDLALAQYEDQPIPADQLDGWLQRI